MGCSTSKHHVATSRSGSKRPGVRGQDGVRMYYDHEWDSFTDSQVHTVSTYLPERATSSFCSLRREAGDGQEESTSSPALDRDIKPLPEAAK